MDALVHRISAWDGQPLVVHEWRDGNSCAPLLCLSGIVRTGSDFGPLARALGKDRRIIAPDYVGRGQSGRSRDIARYAPEAVLRDVLDICAALHVHEAITIGTSFGGLLSLGIAAMRPSLLRAIVLNDIGPELASEGTDFIRNFIGKDVSFPNLDTAVAHLRSILPPLSLETDEAWRAMTELTYAPNCNDILKPVWDTRIARLMKRKMPDLWALFGGVAHLPLLLIWGEVSDILLAPTIERMRSMHPNMTVISLPGVGQAPTLNELDVVTALRDFIEACP